MRLITRIFFAAFIALGVLPGTLALLSGCAAYQLGNSTLYNSNIRTVYIPVARNDSLRPEIGVHLTEAIGKQVELRTPYKVIGDSSADSTITCRITSDTKQVLTENRTDDPRALDHVLIIEVTWTDRRGNVLMQNRIVPPGQFALAFTESSRLVPEAGQSVSTAMLESVQRLAEEIVNQMETRW